MTARRGTTRDAPSARRDGGFTLPELIMAITILGIIAATIGAVLVAAFSSTTGVNDRFDASRAAKQTSVYWTPDVSSAEVVNPVGNVCGAGGGGSIPLITFRSTDHAPLAAAPSPAADAGTPRVTTWWLDDTDPPRIVRRTCTGTDPAHVTPHYPIVTRIADRDGRVAGLATSVSAARGQAVAECSDDAVTFRACTTDDPGRVVRISVVVLDTPADSDPARPGVRLATTYDVQVAGTREVR